MKVRELFEAVINSSAEALDILGATGATSMTDVKTAFRKAAQKFHPDRAAGDGEKMKLVNAAMDFLEKNGLDAMTLPESPPPANFTRAGLKELDEKLEELLTNPKYSYVSRGRTYRKYELAVDFARERIKLAERMIDEILPAYEEVKKSLMAVWKDREQKPDEFKSAVKEFEHFYYTFKPNDVQTSLNRIAKKQASRQATYLKVETPFREKLYAEVDKLLATRENLQNAMKDLERTPAQRERAVKASARMKARWAE